MATLHLQIVTAERKLLDEEASMVIAPGDLIVGDGDGVVCVPYDATSDVLKAAEAKHQAEIKQLAAIKAGKSDRAWVDATLAKLGCTIEG